MGVCGESPTAAKMDDTTTTSDSPRAPQSAPSPKVCARRDRNHERSACAGAGTPASAMGRSAVGSSDPLGGDGSMKVLGGGWVGTQASIRDALDRASSA
jgi:hypothetical protein